MMFMAFSEMRGWGKNRIYIMVGNDKHGLRRTDFFIHLNNIRLEYRSYLLRSNAHMLNQSLVRLEFRH